MRQSHRWSLDVLFWKAIIDDIRQRDSIHIGNWNSVAYMLGTTTYHPQSNGLVERFHRTMKISLKARLAGPNWIDELPWVSLGIQTARKQDLHTSSAELVYDEPLTVPGSFVSTNSIPWSPLKQFRLPNSVPTSSHSNMKVVDREENIAIDHSY